MLASKLNKGTLYDDVIKCSNEKSIEQIIAKEELYRKHEEKRMVI